MTIDFLIGLVISLIICFIIQCSKTQKLKFQNEILELRIEEIRTKFEIYRNITENRNK